MIDTKAASPNSTGPAGARLEAGVAAHYLLALLRGGEARGLPGVRLTRIKLQRGGADHPLDDVIVEGLDVRGKTVGLDIQVKREVRFSPGDAVFKKVMGQIADTLRLDQAAQEDRGLAIAMAQTSHKIDGPYQDVLTWARAIGEPAVPDQSDRAVALWSALEARALAIAAQGGDVTRQQLIDALAPQGFQFASERRHEPARAVLEEASAQVLAEIDDRLGDVVLLRPQAVAAVDAALDQGRYLEIRGAGGVGKSSVLKHLARQVGAQGRVIALNAERTLAGGWPTLRAALGFVGTAKELLIDIAAAGGGVLLIDSVDNFTPPSRALVRDLIGAAVEVPGFQVVVTARSAFGTDEENWLPLAQRKALGQAPPVMLAELSDDEVTELRHAAPGLAPLLADAHPARAVARNLYRLRRLIAQGDAAAQVRTEVDLADLWWRTADGPDTDRRARTRVRRVWGQKPRTGGTLRQPVTRGVRLAEFGVSDNEDVGTLTHIGSPRCHRL